MIGSFSHCLMIFLSLISGFFKKYSLPNTGGNWFKLPNTIVGIPKDKISLAISMEPSSITISFI